MVESEHHAIGLALANKIKPDLLTVQGWKAC
jgi:hypothetical protein